MAEGASGVQDRPVPGYPLPGSQVVELGMCVLPSAQRRNPRLPAVLTQSDRIQAGLYGNFREKWVLG